MALAAINNHLAISLHRLLAEEKENTFFCPFSISSAMAMLLYAAKGETESEIKAACGYESAGLVKEEIPSAFKHQMSLLQSSRNSNTLLCANSMLIRKDLEPKESYKKILAKSFKALVSEVDFENNNEKAVKQINKWAKKQTNKKIPELVHAFHPDTVAVLLNAVYFKGTWLKPFKKSATRKGNFYNKGSERNVKQVDMMYISKRFLFYGNESFQALQLPYRGKKLAMLILLPHEKYGLDSMEAGLLPSFLQDIKENFCETEVRVSIPKFRLDCAKNLRPFFERLGVNRVFKRGAELDVANGSPELCVDEILHKAVLEVNEKDERKNMADSDIDKAEIAEIQQLLDIDNVTNSEQVLKQKYDEDINSYVKLFDFQKFDAAGFDLAKFELPGFDTEKFFRLNEDQIAKLNEDLRKDEEEETRRKEAKNRDQMIRLLLICVPIGIGLVFTGVLLKCDRRKKSDDEEKILDTLESDSVQQNPSAPQEI